MKLKHAFFTFLCLGLFLINVEVQANEIDSRFFIELHEQEDIDLDIQTATELALPILWQRVVPSKDLEKANTLPAATSLLLKFKTVKYGVKMEFNPNQVRSYLSRYNITMIPVQPHFNLSVFAIGISDSDEALSLDLLNYSHNISDELGFRLGPRGKKLQVIFAPVIDVYGETMVHADVQGAFTPDLLSQTDVKSEGFASIQTQDFLKQILLEIRDGYHESENVLGEASSYTLVTIESEFSLSTQVMMEQALSKHPAVLSVVPVLLQKVRRQYRIQLRDGHDEWIGAWFAQYGLTASQQPAGGVDDWLVQ